MWIKVLLINCPMAALSTDFIYSSHMCDTAAALVQLHRDIDARVRSIRESRPDWPCGKGCDSCCKRLAAEPRLTAPEWALLQAGLAALPPVRLAEVRKAVAALAGQGPGPLVCPMLEASTGACPVYVHRPVACRTYGFYLQRDQGLYCGDIESRVAAGGFAEVVWGNHDAIDRQLADLGETRSLGAWFAGWASGAGPSGVLAK